MSEPLLRDDAEIRPARRPRTGNRLIEKVRRASGEFNFAALLSGTYRPSESTAAVVQEEVSATPPPSPGQLVAPPPKPMAPSVLEDHAAELRQLWETDTGVSDGLLEAPSPPWERGRTAPPSVTAVVRAAPVPTYRLGGDTSPYLSGLGKRLALCLWTILLGVCLGAGAAPFLLRTKEKSAPPSAAARVAAAKAPLKKSSSRKPTVKSARSTHAAAAKAPAAQGVAVAHTDLEAVRWPAAALLICSLFWIAGAPHLFGRFQGHGFITLAAGVLALSVWSGARATLAVIESRVRSGVESPAAAGLRPSGESAAVAKRAIRP